MAAVRAVLQDYSRTSTIHGIAIIGDRRTSRPERLFWAAAVLLSAAFMFDLCWTQWMSFLAQPTVTKIQQNNLPIYSVAFPAVTICPAAKIKKSVLIASVDEYLSLMNHPLRKDLLNGSVREAFFFGMAQTLTYYQYPLFSLMRPGLSAMGNLVPIMDGFAISHFMIKARLTCVDVLEICYWKGSAFACCEQFQVQRTEQGYCMSFNSRTSTGPKILCPERNCHHVWQKGPGTGLVVVFKEHFTEEDKFFKQNGMLQKLPLRDPGRGVSASWEQKELFLLLNSWMQLDHIHVMVHNRQMFPDVTRALSFSNRRNHGYSMAVSFRGTATAPEIKTSVPITSRGCVFYGEQEVHLARYYSQEECVSECRALHVVKHCGCRPYFIESYDGLYYKRLPECRFSQLPCLSGLNLLALNCSHCLPACNLQTYYVRTTPSISQLIRDIKLGSFIEVSYDQFDAAVRFEREITYSFQDLVVSIGGFVSLCLGCSILTSLDIVYVLVRVFNAALFYKMTPIYQNDKIKGKRT